MRISQALFLCTILANSINAQPDIDVFFDRYIFEKEKFLSMTYEVEISKKYFSMDEIKTKTANVILTRSKSDTLFHGFVSIEFDSLWFGYDGRFIYSGNKNTSVLERADAIIYPEAFILSTWVGDYVEKTFLNRYREVKGIIELNQEYLTPIDTTIQQTEYVMLLLQFPDAEGFSNQHLSILIDKKSLILAERSHIATFQDNDQITKWKFRNVEFSETQLALDAIESQLSKFSSIKDFPEVSFIRMTSENFPLRSVRGIKLNGSEMISIVEDTTHYKILDFWYSSCYPCIKSIPIINRIAEEYAQEPIKVYGVNLIDDPEKQSPRLVKYQKNNPMHYPTIMIEKTEWDNFPGIEYPTFMILDRKGNVVFMERGFSEDMYTSIKTVLDDLLSGN